MFHISFFATTSGDMAPSGFSALTVFGTAELRRPTLASLLLDHKRRAERRQTRWDAIWNSDENLVITMFGGVTLHAQPVAEEFGALTALLRSGALGADECKRFLDEVPELGRRQIACRTLTLFGTCSVHYPKPKVELQAIEAAERAGTISAAVRPRLESILEAPPEGRIRLVGDFALHHA